MRNVIRGRIQHNPIAHGIRKPVVVAVVIIWFLRVAMIVMRAVEPVMRQLGLAPLKYLPLGVLQLVIKLTEAVNAASS
jgi:hypothetical protein